MSDTFSITISPRGDVPEEWFDLLVNHFTKKDWTYSICNELGEGNDHLQVALTTPYRSDNIRRMLIKILSPVFQDDDEKRCWLKISKTDDPYYSFGYTMKEIGNGRNFKSSFNEDELQECWEYYEKVKKSGNLIGGWECKGINALLPYCLDFAKKNNLIDRNIKLRSIIVILVNNNKIPYSLGRKIRKDDEIFWKDILNKELGICNDTPLMRINNINDYMD